MGVKYTPLMSVLAMLALTTPIYAICPARCHCNDHSLKVACAEGNLEVFPIIINPEVRHLDLSRNAIHSIYYTLNFYTNLIYLDLSHNKLISLGALNFISQHNLTYLNVSYNQLDRLKKDSFKGLTNLIELNLSYNYIGDLQPHSFQDLHSLENLHLTGNQLIFLEENVFHPLKHLKSLYLDKNQFLDMPASSLNAIHSLRHLVLSQNLIDVLNESSILTLPNLSTLHLDRNLLNAIEKTSLSKLISLTSLDLSDNNFTTIPTDSLSKLTNLTLLRFTGNFVQYLPSVAFRGLFHLKTIFMDRLEYLKKIDSRAFVDNINLEKVHLDNNIALSSLPTRLFYGNHKLVRISIRNNQLTTLDASHLPVDQLQSLKLGGNPWECNCTLLWLWRLAQEQDVNNRNVSQKLDIDIESILCSGPTPVKGSLLVNVKESVISCSLSWMATVSAASFACILIALTLTLIYYGILKSRRGHLVREPVPCCSGQAVVALSYDNPHKLDPHLIHDYETLPPWSPFLNYPNDTYRHFDNSNVNLQPHIVYV